MTRTILFAAAGALLATSAAATPLMSQKTAVAPSSVAENVRLVCNEYGRCYRTRGYATRRYYGDSSAYGRRVYVEPSYGYSEPSYGYGGPGYYGGGPSIGFSFGGGRW